MVLVAVGLLISILQAPSSHVALGFHPSVPIVPSMGNFHEMVEVA
jgi:hypothetical protein